MRRPSIASALIRVQGPWQMAAMGLWASEKERTKSNRVVLHAQLVGIGDAAGQDQGVIIGGVGGRDLQVDGDLATLLVVQHALDLAGLQRDDVDLRARGAQRLDRLFQFRLLEPVGRQDRDLAAVQTVAEPWGVSFIQGPKNPRRGEGVSAWPERRPRPGRART